MVASVESLCSSPPPPLTERQRELVLLVRQLAPQLAVRLDDLLQVPCGAFTVEFMDIADLDHEVPRARRRRTGARPDCPRRWANRRACRNRPRGNARARVRYPVERGHRSGPAVRQLDPHLVGATAGIRERHERCRAVQHGEVVVHRVGGDRPFDAMQPVGHDDLGSAVRLDTPTVPSRGRDTHRRAAVRCVPRSSARESRSSRSDRNPATRWPSSLRSRAACRSER